MLKKSFLAPQKLWRSMLPGALAACAFGFAPSMMAQAVDQAAEAEPEDQDVIVLSPFVVEGSEDEGKYRANATLAGSRVRTDLRDIASPLSVVTSQFLKDTATTSNQDLLVYTTNTEVGGLFGNWGGFGNSQGVSDRGTLLAPSQNTRVRGLDQADNTRNFMLSNIPWDSYNVDRVEIQRGPNSILFGVGSPAGIINTNTIQARFDGNSGKVENQVSSHESLRWVVDYNVEVIDDLLAIRFAGLLNDQKFQQKPAFSDDRRGYLTATFEPQVLPKSWAGRTSIRANAEHAKITANRPRILPPEDGISLWFEDYEGDGVSDKIGYGKRVYDMFLWSQRGGGDPGRGLNAGSQVLNPLPYQPGLTQIDGGALNNGGLGFFFINGESRPYFVSRQAPRSYPGALNASGGIDNAIDIPYGSPARVGGLNSYAVAVDKIDEINGVPSRFPLATRGYYKDQSLTDPTIFNFYDYLIDGDNKREFQEWDAFNVAISQTFLNNRIGVEFVYDSQSYSEWRGGSAWNRPYISIDINKNLQNQLSQYDRTDDGDDDPTTENGLIDPSTYMVYGFTPSSSRPYANPMAGAAFTAGSFSNNNRTDIDRKNLRLTAFAELKGSDVFERDSMLSRIIGTHRFTGLKSREENETADTIWSPSATTYDWAYGLSVGGGNSRLGESARGITPIIYLSEPLFSRSSASGLNLGPIQTYYNPSGSYLVDYFKTEWKPSRNTADPTYVDPGAQWINLLGGVGVQADNPFNYTGRVSAPTNVLNADAGDWEQLISDYTEREDVIDSVGFVWQGHLLDGLIVPTVGWREDTLVTYTARGAEDATGISSTKAGLREKGDEIKGKTTSWGVVGHLPQKWLENVPVVSGISAYYNYGENFRVQTRYNYDGQPLVNPSAESVDYGIVLSAFDDRLNIKVGKYETKVKNANLPGGSNLLGNNMYYLYQLEAWGTANTLLYAFGRSGLDPNQGWHWNWAMIAGIPGAAGTPEDPNHAWDEPYWRTGPDGTTESNARFLAHPDSISQLAAMDAWMAGLDEQFFENYAINVNPGALKTAYATWRATGNIQPLVAAALPSFPVGSYTDRLSSQNNGQIRGISPNGTIDNTSEGYEIEVNWTPTPNWNIQVNAAKTNAYRENLGQPMLDYIDKQWARLQGPAGDIRLWWGGERTIEQFYQDNIISAVEFQQESIGFQVPELRPWRFGVITNYSFDKEFLKGFNVGGAYRWQDKQILGYGLKDDKSGLDVRKPLSGESEGHADLWVGYQRKIHKDITWRIQLNLRNVGESEGLTPISVNPDGVVAAQRITEGMSWAVTNTISF